MRFNFLVIVFLLLNNFSLSADHIVGGEMTYRCLGGGDYEFELYVYQECLQSDPIPFEQNIRIAIYECDGTIDCASLIQHNIDPVNASVTNFLTTLVSEEEIIPNDIECLIPSNIPCVTRGTYKFRLSDSGITLANSPNTYYIVYQRCCRNERIVNIPNPTEQGNSFFVGITPFAQEVCNNSPTFNNFPDLITCQNFDIDYFHSATDTDGDSLVYFFDTPVHGGGTIESSRDCDGTQPEPPCPPPYRRIDFNTGYSSTNPLGISFRDTINTSVTIDSMTGFISGIPSVAGLFVISAVVEEYRDGRLLGAVRRDFQHQIVPCERSITAIITSDEVIGDNAFRTTVCQEGSILFEHESQPSEFVNSIRWNFDLKNGTVAASNNEQIQVDFPIFGDYLGTLYVNEESKNCADSATINVSIFPETIANFEFDYDTCDANAPVNFINLSTTQSDGIDTYNWNFGDGSTSTDFMPTHQYTSAGALEVTLTAIDENNCSAEEIKTLDYFPLSEELFPPPMGIDECAPVDITFDNLEGILTDDYAINWNFGDGNTSTEVAPTHVYENSGNFGVTLSILSPSGCQTESVYGNLVRVSPSPTADFSFTPEEIKIVNPTANFIDQSLNAASWNWDFNGLDRSNEQNPVFTFPDTGMQVVTLIVEHQSGCTDTTSAIIDIIPSIDLFVPNAFTPNGDGLNDLFLPVGFSFGSLEYRFSIWNRWGEQVFSTMTFGEGWNGQKNNVGKVAPSGVYTYLIEFVDNRGEKHTRQGYATLVR